MKLISFFLDTGLVNIVGYFVIGSFRGISIGRNVLPLGSSAKLGNGEKASIPITKLVSVVRLAARAALRKDFNIGS